MDLLEHSCGCRQDATGHDNKPWFSGLVPKVKGPGQGICKIQTRKENTTTSVLDGDSTNVHNIGIANSCYLSKSSPDNGLSEAVVFIR